jgi:hypothetical protein
MQDELAPDTRLLIHEVGVLGCEHFERAEVGLLRRFETAGDEIASCRHDFARDVLDRRRHGRKDIERR